MKKNRGIGSLIKKINKVLIIFMSCILIIESYQASVQESSPSGTLFVVYGDSSRFDEEGIYVHQKIVSNILLHNPDFVLYTGDMVNDSSFKEEWQTHLKITKPIHNILYPTPGDNEKPKNNKEVWRIYSEVYPGFYNGADYYSFNKDNIHIISLDSNINFSYGSEQYNWLAKDLEDHKDFKWKFILFHHPPYYHEYYKLERDKKDLVQLLEKYGIDIVFNSDYHLYARSFPVYEDEINTKKGITYIITGGGGSNLGNAFKYNFLFPKSVKAYHFVKIRILNDTLELSAYDINNEKIDEYKIIKSEKLKISFKEKLIIYLKRYVFNEQIRKPIQVIKNLIL